MFSATFEEGKGDDLLGGAPDPEHDNDENIISVFINKVINPDKPFGSSVSWLPNQNLMNQETKSIYRTFLFVSVYTRTDAAQAAIPRYCVGG